MLPIVLLLLAAALMLVRPFGTSYWVGPLVCAAFGLLTAQIAFADAWSSLGPLRDPLLLLTFAVPLAVTLDTIGVFEALAASVDGGRHLVAWLWVLAAGVVIVFNLDAAVVLLTPLYVRIAVRHGHSPEALAFQPALLACLASGLLPVSNLTNLIVAEELDLGVVDFLANMALPTAVACSIGYVAYRWTFPVSPERDPVDDPVDRRALRDGLPIIAFVLVGFTLGDMAGVPAWVVAAAAAVWAAARCRRVPWRTVPVGALVVAASLAVLVAAAVPSLHLDAIFDRSGIRGDLGVLAFGAIGSNLTNNLPTVLAGTHAITDVGHAWPLLIGANMAPLLVLTGSLSGLLWQDTARRVGVRVSAGRYTAVGLRVGLPGLVGAALVAVLV